MHALVRPDMQYLNPLFISAKLAQLPHPLLPLRLSPSKNLAHKITTPNGPKTNLLPPERMVESLGRDILPPLSKQHDAPIWTATDPTTTTIPVPHGTARTTMSAAVTAAVAALRTASLEILETGSSLSRRMCSMIMMEGDSRSFDEPEAPVAGEAGKVATTRSLALGVKWKMNDLTRTNVIPKAVASESGAGKVVEQSPSPRSIVDSNGFSEKAHRYYGIATHLRPFSVSHSCIPSLESTTIVRSRPRGEVQVH